MVPHIPLYFRFAHVVFGRGFAADVRFLGRATCAREFGSTWMYGVNPGVLAEEGDSMPSAYANFRNALVGVLFDLAEEADGFETFRAAARSFFDATDDVSVREWLSAREAIRAGHDPGIDAGLDLHKETGEPPSGFTVVEVHPAEADPDLNHFIPDQPNLLAA